MIVLHHNNDQVANYTQPDLELEEAAADIDCPMLTMLTGTLLAILLLADDIALFTYSASGHEKQLYNFCAKRGLTVNVKKTKILVLEPRKSSVPSFFCNGDINEQVDEFKYLGS